MAQCGTAADLYGQRNSVCAVDTTSINCAKTKVSTIKTKYKAKIASAEQELSSLTGEGRSGAEQVEVDNSADLNLENHASALKAEVRALEYEIDLAQERIRAEEARGTLWNVWSAAAERTASHHPKDQSIITALNAVVASRLKIITSIQSYIQTEEAEGKNRLVQSWQKNLNEPAWPPEIKHDAWWPTKTAADNEKTLHALLGSADRAVRLAKRAMYCKSATQYQEPTSQTRGKISLIAAQNAQQGSAEVLSSLNTAAYHLKQLSESVRR